MSNAAKVLLIGGTSHVGKSTYGKELAQSIGWNHLSTDRLARHPGRPWRVGQSDVPRDVVNHYLCLSTAESLLSVLTHYRQNVWPIADAIIRSHSNNPFDPHLVLEGSAILPEQVARSNFADASAIWLTAPEDVIRQRIYDSSQYAQRAETEKQLIEAFLQRSLAFNQLILEQVRELDLRRLDASSPDTMDKLRAECQRHVG